MKFLIALAGLILAVARADYQYDPALISQLLDNPRLISAYTDCVLGAGPCTKEGTEAKKMLPEVIDTSCAKCSEQDKENAAKLAKSLKNNFPEKYNALLKKFDPEGKKLSNLDQFIKQYAP